MSILVVSLVCQLTEKGKNSIPVQLIEAWIGWQIIFYGSI